MPPYTLWLRGRTDIATWMRGGGMRCSGSRLVRSAANGSPALAQWRPTASGGFDPWAVHVLDISAGQITRIDCFRDPRLVQLFQTFQPAITPALADRA